MPKNQKIKLTAPKGRPMLNWVGKQPLDYIKSFPAQLVETFNPLASPLGRGVTEGDGVGNLSFKSLEHNWQNLLFHGDNKEILGTLLNNGFRGKIDLIYIDPPFDSGADYIRKIELRGVKDKTKIEGEDYNYLEQTQYFDIWNQDGYLQFLYERLLLLHELLKDEGNIFVQVDDKRGHYVKIIMDEIFGPDNYINDIIWYKGREGGGGTVVNPPLPTEYQNIYLYSKNRRNRKWNPPKGPYKESTLTSLQKDENGWFYTRGRMGRKPRPWEIEAGVSKKTYVNNNPHIDLDELLKQLTSKDAKEVLIGDVWDNKLVKNSVRMNYPTEKPEELLSLIIEAATNENDIVLDCFIGSGTTAAVAQKLGRRWIGCDINKGAIQTTSKRLQKIILEQIDEEKKKHPELFSPLTKGGDTEEVRVCRSFSHYKVNDYDLQLLRTEAIELAVQHLGIQRSKTETFFDGTLGKTLVKLIDFNHPLTLLDLQLLQDELKKRPKEQRNITIVCLGKELATEPWLEEYNKKHPVNKVQVIELRTDSKYGKFLIHQPAIADVEIKKENKSPQSGMPKTAKAVIDIKSFISPTILERLNMDDNLFKVKIPDFRSMIDVVLIDNNYDDKVFNIFFSDVPEKKNDLIAGHYEIEIPSKDSKIAVKIIDMLGEEVLIIP